MPRTHLCLIPVGLLTSILVFITLSALSSVPPYAGQTLDVEGVSTHGAALTLWQGETQRVTLPPLVQSVQVNVVSTSPSTSAVNAAIFYSPHTCPPLTGPTILLQQDLLLDMAGGAFEYDYYSLHAGSTIQVSFQQYTGSTYVYLLQGQDTLLDVISGRNTDPEHWEVVALAKRYLRPQSPAINDLFYRVTQDDVYMLVYDNALIKQESLLDVQSDIVVTTYNLANQTPLLRRIGYSRVQSVNTVLDCT